MNDSWLFKLIKRQTTKNIRKSIQIWLIQTIEKTRILKLFFFVIIVLNPTIIVIIENTQMIQLISNSEIPIPQNDFIV